MPRTLTMFFPDGKTEYWLTAMIFKSGDKLNRNGQTWIVSSVGETDGQIKHMSITLRQDGDSPSSQDGNSTTPS
jgi:hypothetical protein